MPLRELLPADFDVQAAAGRPAEREPAISEADASAKDFRTKLDMVNQYMRHSALPQALREKVRTYFALFFPAKRSFDEVGILSEISTPLRQEIAQHKCRLTVSQAKAAFIATAADPQAGLTEEELLECVARCGVDKYRGVAPMPVAVAVRGFISNLLGRANEEEVLKQFAMEAHL